MVPTSDKPPHYNTPRASSRKWNLVIGTVYKRNQIPPIGSVAKGSEGLIQGNVTGIEYTVDGINVSQNLLTLWRLNIDSRCGSGR